MAKIAAIQRDFACVLIKHLFFLFEQIFWNALSCLYSPNILFIQKNVLAWLQLLFGYKIRQLFSQKLLQVWLGGGGGGRIVICLGGGIFLVLARSFVLSLSRLSRQTLVTGFITLQWNTLPGRLQHVNWMREMQVRLAKILNHICASCLFLWFYFSVSVSDLSVLKSGCMDCSSVN